MDHNRTETTIMSSNTIKSASYCPHIPQIIWDVHDTISPWIFAAFESIISPAAVLLNALVIIAVMKRRELQKLSNILLSSLAVTDLLVGAICIPLSAIDGFLLPCQILAAQHICTLDVATVWLSLTLTFCSLFHLVLIAWERKNRLADSLSRLQVQSFKQLAPAHMDKLPTEIPLHQQPQSWQP